MKSQLNRLWDIWNFRSPPLLWIQDETVGCSMNSRSSIVVILAPVPVEDIVFVNGPHCNAISREGEVNKCTATYGLRHFCCWSEVKRGIFNICDFFKLLKLAPSSPSLPTGIYGIIHTSTPPHPRRAPCTRYGTRPSDHLTSSHHHSSLHPTSNNTIILFIILSVFSFTFENFTENRNRSQHANFQTITHWNYKKK